MVSALSKALLVRSVPRAVQVTSERGVVNLTPDLYPHSLTLFLYTRGGTLLVTPLHKIWRIRA
jgi:hypothetical protein